MFKASQMAIGLILSAWTLGYTSSATAQLAPPPTTPTTPAPSAALMMNPFYNPYMNPLLNPSAPQQKMNTASALLYLNAANSARGGIGSGRLSNPGTQAARKRPSNMPNTASTPGGGAARFFNPGPRSGGGAGRYYNQYGGHFQNNGN